MIIFLYSALDTPYLNYFGPQCKEGCPYAVVSSVEGSEDVESGALGWSAVKGSFPTPVGRLWRVRIFPEVCVGEGEATGVSRSRGGSDWK